MLRRQQRLWKFMIVAAVGMLGGLSFLGCAAEKHSAPPAQQQIKSDSDRFFDKLKQEERERARAAEKPMP
ncbi:MAG: hypothetical protein AAB093_04875 [Nitrospirota bacterium]